MTQKAHTQVVYNDAFTTTTVAMPAPMPASPYNKAVVNVQPQKPAGTVDFDVQVWTCPYIATFKQSGDYSKVGEQNITGGGSTARDNNAQFSVSGVMEVIQVRIIQNAGDIDDLKIHVKLKE